MKDKKINIWFKKFDIVKINFLNFLFKKVNLCIIFYILSYKINN